MSTEHADPLNSAGPTSEQDDLRAIVADLAERLSEAEAELASKDERIDELEERVEDLEEQPSVERKENDKKGKHLEEYYVDGLPFGTGIANATKERKKLRNRVFDLEETETGVEEVRDDVDELREDLVAEQQMRSQQDSLVERRVAAVGEKAGVEISDADLVDDDKIAQLLRVGPDAVTDRVYAVHRRARTMLENARDWGTVVSDGNGVRVVFKAPEVRPYLDARFDREFSTSEVERIFSKVEDLAADSPRKVQKRKTDEGNHLLAVWAMHEEDPLLAE
jgi:polyhydroxyalkanoate synthesis regulator phasin